MNMPPHAATRAVTCPICLSPISWTDLKPFRWDDASGRYEELTVADNLGPEQRERLMRNVSWRCPNVGGELAMHFLPEAYGQYGRPVVLGFIGDNSSGKTHLLAAMVGAIERGELDRYGLTGRAVDLHKHRAFLADSVTPLLEKSAVLKYTDERIINFADAFLIGREPNELRPVALFDVAGEELRNVTDTKRFLEIADGFVFVIDPDQLGKTDLGDPAFNTVLSIVAASGRLRSVSAAVVLNKADQVRFDDPVALWMRRPPDVLDPEAVAQESADVYAYLCSRNATAWARPFRECAGATLHFASATGSRKADGSDAGYYPRKVRPQRVLAPLLSLLAMTGVLEPSGGTGA